jgi:DNA anti-recombination protein RmuC
VSDVNNRLLDVERKVSANEVLIGRFDTALDKISEVSLNVSKLLAVHEQRLETQEANSKESKEANAILHLRVTSTEQRLRQEMSEGQKEILSEIKSLRSDVEEMGDEITQKAADMKTSLEAEFSSKIDTVSSRVTKLERLAYIVVGGATVVGFLLSQAMGFLQLFH